MAHLRPPQARRYLRRYLTWLRLSDLLAVSVAVVVAVLLRFGVEQEGQVAGVGQSDVSYSVVSIGLIAVWMLSLHLQHTYDGRFSGHGVQEYRQVFRACVAAFVALAIVAFAVQLDLARGFALIAFPLGTVLLLVGRWLARSWLVRKRVRGELSDRVLLVGDQEHLTSLVAALKRAPAAGYHVLGACVGQGRHDRVAGVPVVGTAAEVVEQAVALQVDVVAVSSSAGLGTQGLRRLGWALEGTDIDLVVAPEIMDVAGPRVMTRPVQGLPLIHVEAPRFGGPQAIVKTVLDRLAAAVGILVLSPLLLVLALGVFVQDRGPVLFTQKRVGLDGRSFPMIKFRSMRTDADSLLPALMEMNEGAGPLFKMKDDPRVTRIGRFIRKYSLDELPQLFNVIRGEMSLVGPRPPLPREVAEYGSDARRRLLVKPGLTGLWQISGRSDLSWEEAVRLDLYYVENWTPVLDLMIIWRTFHVVLAPGRNGAY